MRYKIEYNVKKYFKKFSLFLAEKDLEKLLRNTLDGRTVYQFQKQRIKKSGLLLLLLVVGIILKLKLNYFLFVTVGSLLVYLIPYMQLKDKNKSIRIKNDLLFPNYIKMLITLLNHNTVYRAIEESRNYVNPHMKHILNLLLIEIDQDTSVQPYLNFADRFNSSNARMIMTMLYYYDKESGNIEYLSNVSKMNDKIKNNQIKELVINKADKMQKFGTHLQLLAMLEMFAFIGYLIVISFQSVAF